VARLRLEKLSMRDKTKQASQLAKGEGKRIRRARNIVKRVTANPCDWIARNVSPDKRETMLARYKRAVALLAYYELSK